MSKSATKSKPKAAKPVAKAPPVKVGLVNIGTCMTEKGRGGLEKAAEKAGMTLSAFVRTAAFEKAKMPVELHKPGRPRKTK